MAWKEKKKYDVELSYEDLKRVSEISTLDDVVKEREEIEIRLQKLDLHRKVLLQNEDRVFDYMFHRWVKVGDVWNNYTILNVGSKFTTFIYVRKNCITKLAHKNLARKLYRYSIDFKTLVDRDVNISKLLDE